MSISEERSAPGAGAAHTSLLALLVLANAGLVVLGAGLGGRRFGSDAAESPTSPPRAYRRLDARGILRNPDYFAWLCDRVRAQRGILFFGTSESGTPHNLGAQLNDIGPEDPPLTVLPVKGMSPIHSAVLFARTRRERTPLPPAILVVNLVYFTASHDIIDDGWLSTVVRHPVFLQFDHDGARRHLSARVRDLYDSHLRPRTPLVPLLYQQYAGNLLYLSRHQATGPLPEDIPPPERYHFDGSVPEYLADLNVHPDGLPSDRAARGRWRVRSESECRNLLGLESTAAILRDGPAPALLLVLPVNRAFYRQEGLDMAEFEARYGALRRRIAGLAVPGRIFVVDMYEQPPLDRGFEDRMHADEYGNHQLARALADLPDYRRFIAAVEAHYDPAEPPPSGP